MDADIKNYIDLICYVVTLASVVVKLTPTTSDDKAVAKLQKFLAILALNKK